MYSITAGFEIAKALLGITGCAGGDIKGTPTTPPGTCEEDLYEFSETEAKCPNQTTTTIDYNNTDYYYESDESNGHTDVIIKLTSKPESPITYSFEGTFYGVKISEDSSLIELKVYDDPSTDEVEGLVFCKIDENNFSNQLILSISAPLFGITYYIGVQFDTDESYNITFIELYMVDADLLDGDINEIWNEEYLDPALTVDDTSSTCE